MDEQENITIEELQAQIEEKDKLIEEQKNKLLRALADFDNFKKRAVVEQENFLQYANEGLIKELLPSLDSFERALFVSEKSSDEFIKGIALVKRQFTDALNKFGVEEVKALGLPYDPHFHEAILKKESDKPENTVIEEMQKGYTLNGRLIRPAMVIVSKEMTNFQ